MQHFWESASITSVIDILRAKLFGAPAPAKPRLLPAAAAPAAAPAASPAQVPALEFARTPTQRAEYIAFLSTHFLTAGPNGPRSALTADTLETLVYAGARPLLYRQPVATGHPGKLVGCILSAPLGKLYRGGGVRGGTPFEVRLIRDFCVAADQRGTGVGSALLLGVLRDCGEQGAPYGIFLKEGAPLARAGAPLRTSAWMWRRVAVGGSGGAPDVRELSLRVALDLVGVFGVSNRRLLYNRPAEDAPAVSATRFFLYDGFRGAALAAFTPAYQVHPRDGAAIIFQTGWLETGELLPTERVAALRKITDAAAEAMEAPWVWADRGCLGAAPLPAPWRADGPFHWYGYGWTADLYGDAELFLVL